MKRTPRGLAVLVGGLAAILWVIAAIVSPRTALISLLIAASFGVSIAVGALSLLTIGIATRARWTVPWVPELVHVARSIAAFAVLFVPLLIAIPILYPWVTPAAALSEHARRAIEAARPYLNVPFFVIRTIFYFAVWIGWTLALARRPASRAVAAAGIPILAVTSAFAAIDWFVSLVPGWYSAIYGLLYWAGGFLAALGALGGLAWWADRRRNDAGRVGERHYHALGNLTLAMVLFWGYVSFVQFLIIWIGNIPDEIGWYQVRMHGAWGIVAVFLIAGGFTLPLLLLLFRRFNSSPAKLAGLGIWLVVVHYVESYWLVAPTFHPHGLNLGWTDLLCLTLVAAILAWCTAGEQDIHPAVK